MHVPAFHALLNETLPYFRDNPKYATIDEDESRIVGGQAAEPGQIPHQVRTVQ
jgi:hypothetical protein